MLIYFMLIYFLKEKSFKKLIHMNKHLISCIFPHSPLIKPVTNKTKEDNKKYNRGHRSILRKSYDTAKSTKVEALLKNLLIFLKTNIILFIESNSYKLKQLTRWDRLSLATVGTFNKWNDEMRQQSDKKTSQKIDKTTFSIEVK